MKIEKNGHIYIITETEKNWKLTEDKNGSLSVTYNIPKEIAPSADELKDYVLDNDMF